MTTSEPIADRLAAAEELAELERRADMLGRRLYTRYTRMIGQKSTSEGVWPESVTEAQRGHWREVAVAMDDESRKDVEREMSEWLSSEIARAEREEGAEVDGSPDAAYPAGELAAYLAVQRKLKKEIER